MTTEVDSTRAPDNSREEALKQLLARGAAVEAAALDTAGPVAPSSLQARAVADGHFAGPDAVSHKAAVMLSLQRSHGNAYVQRLVSRSASRAPHVIARPGPAPAPELQPEEEEPNLALLPPEAGAGFAPPDAPPSSNGGSTPPASPPATPPDQPGNEAAPGLPSASGASSPAPPAARASNGGAGIARITLVDDLLASETAHNAE